VGPFSAVLHYAAVKAERFPDFCHRSITVFNKAASLAHIQDSAICVAQMLTFKIKSNYKLRKIIFKEIIRMIMEDDITTGT